MTKPEINHQLIAAHQGLYSSAAASLQPHYAKPEKWSVAQNLVHINISLERLNHYLMLPKSVIESRFGRSEKAAISYNEMADIIRAIYEKGVKTTTPFEPPQELKTPISVFIDQGHQLLETYTHHLKNWSEEELNQYHCPHPLLGTVSAREILYFTIYHVRHHQQTIENLNRDEVN
ncbi:DinB family protein [Flavobacterium sp. CYK-55]|uniref:DinB family protein n=1 Tax=Flavobacterium sp. CYK-55 TaxID=2835529 RepID=UPI001BCB186D|nr:DinB family protein [Flavobacterium sp. CYK-55]MBS7787980.1 DinB family protein [Flavobacterium sp. CYK-55]